MTNESVFPPDRVTIVGVLNVTPDSFSDGGHLLAGDGRLDAGRLVDRAHALVEGGAHVLDVGGESTRPGAREVGADEEIARTADAIALLREHLDVPISSTSP